MPHLARPAILRPGATYMDTYTAAALLRACLKSRGRPGDFLHFCCDASELRAVSQCTVFTVELIPAKVYPEVPTLKTHGSRGDIENERTAQNKLAAVQRPKTERTAQQASPKLRGHSQVMHQDRAVRKTSEKLEGWT